MLGQTRQVLASKVDCLGDDSDLDNKVIKLF